MIHHRICRCLKDRDARELHQEAQEAQDRWLNLICSNQVSILTNQVSVKGLVLEHEKYREVESGEREKVKKQDNFMC